MDAMLMAIRASEAEHAKLRAIIKDLEHAAKISAIDKVISEQAAENTRLRSELAVMLAQHAQFDDALANILPQPPSNASTSTALGTGPSSSARCSGEVISPGQSIKLPLGGRGEPINLIPLGGKVTLVRSAAKVPFGGHGEPINYLSVATPAVPPAASPTSSRITDACGAPHRRSDLFTPAALLVGHIQGGAPHPRSDLVAPAALLVGHIQGGAPHHRSDLVAPAALLVSHIQLEGGAPHRRSDLVAPAALLVSHNQGGAPRVSTHASEGG